MSGSVLALYLLVGSFMAIIWAKPCEETARWQDAIVVTWVWPIVLGVSLFDEVAICQAERPTKLLDLKP